MKLVFLIFILLVVSNAYSQQAYAENTSNLASETEWIAKMMKWDDSTPITEEINTKHIREADLFINENSINPIIWWYRGALGRGEVSFYHRALLKEGKYYHPSIPKAKTLIKKYQSYYRKALDLDEKADAPAHLTVDMLNAMASDVLAAPDIKERAYKKAIALAQAGKADVVNENFEYETYEFLLESYSEQKNPDKYLATLNEMIARFPNSPRMNELLEYKRHVQEVIAKRDGKAAQIDVYAQADAYAQPKAAAVQTPAKAIATQKPTTPKASHETANTSTSDENTLLWWLLGGGALLALGGLYISRRKKG